MGLFFITAAVFGFAILALSVGVMFTKDKEIGGSCGGPDVNSECCQTCPEKEGCDDVRALDVEVPAVHARRAVASLGQAP